MSRARAVFDSRTLRPALLLLCTLPIVACGASEQEKRESEIMIRESSIEFEVMSAVLLNHRIDCPNEIDADKGDSFRCTVRVGRTNVVVKAVQTDDEGHARLLTKLMDPHEVEAQLDQLITERLEERRSKNRLYNLARTHECEDDLLEVKKGGKFKCRSAYDATIFTTQAGFRIPRITTQEFEVRAKFTGVGSEFTYAIRLIAPESS